MQIVNTHTVPPDSKKVFLNIYAPEVFDAILSKGRAKKAIARGEIRVNGRKVSRDYMINPGDKIELLESAKKKKIYAFDLEVCFEDEHLAVVNKPGGLPVNGNTFKTLENALTHNLKPSKKKDALAYPMPVHRIDAPTCGLVLIAKTATAQIHFGKAFEQKDIDKEYMAVVIGTPQKEQTTIDEPIEGKKSISHVKVVRKVLSKKYGNLSMVQLIPETGRTHQLRIHMEKLGHPIVGDSYYPAGQEVLKGKGLFLCARKLSFQHPENKKTIDIEINPPNKFDKYMDRESFRAENTN